MQPIILLSLPRSGSTLMQRCLAAHPEICSAAESWLLLPGAYALRQRGIVSEYGHSFLQMGVEDFCDGLPGKQDDYFREYGDMVARLYEKRFGAGRHRYFLEKTPRNNLIVDEILCMFPSAKIILLWRNPVSVLASMVRSFHKNQWKPGDINIDITCGIEGLCRAANLFPDRIRTVKYEDFVVAPREILMNLTEYLDLEFHDSMTDLNDEEVLKGRLGDKTGPLKYQQISTESLKSGLEHVFHNWYRVSQVKKLLEEWESKGHLDTMGYRYENLLAELPQDPRRHRGVLFDLYTEYREKSRMLMQSIGLLQTPGARQKLYY